VFDKYRCSRPYDEAVFKISWHMSLFPDKYCMLVAEQGALAK